jgi:hypothetical protein
VETQGDLFGKEESFLIMHFVGLRKDFSESYKFFGVDVHEFGSGSLDGGGVKP